MHGLALPGASHFCSKSCEVRLLCSPAKDRGPSRRRAATASRLGSSGAQAYRWACQEPSWQTARPVEAAAAPVSLLRVKQQELRAFTSPTWDRA